MSPFVATCPINMPHATLSAWRDHELPANEAQATQRHVQTCTACQGYIAALDVVDQAIRRNTAPSNVQDAIWRNVRATITSQRGPMRNRQRALALSGIGVAAIVVALFVVVFAVLPSKHTTTQLVQTPPPKAASVVAFIQIADPPGPSSLVGYDSATGRLRFTHVLTSGTDGIGDLAATRDRLGLIEATPGAGQQLSTTLEMYDATGTQIRQVPLGGFIPSFLIGSSDTFFVGGEDSAGVTKATATPNTPQMFIRAIAASTGAQRWQQTVSNATAFTYFVLANKKLIGVSANGNGGTNLIALDTTTGHIDWQVPFTTNSSLISPIVPNGDIFYSIVQSTNGTTLVQTLAAYSIISGAVLWHKDFPSNGSPNQAAVAQLVAVDQGAVYCRVSTLSANVITNSLVAFASSDGHQIATLPGGESLDNVSGQTSPIVNGVLYVPSAVLANSVTPPLPTDKLSLNAIDIATKTVLWSAPLSGSPLIAPTVAGSAIYVGVTTHSATTGASGNAAIDAFSNTGAPLWQAAATTPYISPIFTLP